MYNMHVRMVVSRKELNESQTGANISLKSFHMEETLILAMVKNSAIISTSVSSMLSSLIRDVFPPLCKLLPIRHLIPRVPNRAALIHSSLTNNPHVLSQTCSHSLLQLPSQPLVLY